MTCDFERSSTPGERLAGFAAASVFSVAYPLAIFSVQWIDLEFRIAF